MHLTEQEKQILDGKWGEAAHIAMSILTELGESIGAKDKKFQWSPLIIKLSRYLKPASMQPSMVSMVKLY